MAKLFKDLKEGDILYMYTGYNGVPSEIFEHPVLSDAKLDDTGTMVFVSFNDEDGECSLCFMADDSFDDSGEYYIISTDKDELIKRHNDTIDGLIIHYEEYITKLKQARL